MGEHWYITMVNQKYLTDMLSICNSMQNGGGEGVLEFTTKKALWYPK